MIRWAAGPATPGPWCGGSRAGPPRMRRTTGIGGPPCRQDKPVPRVVVEETWRDPSATAIDIRHVKGDVHRAGRSAVFPGPDSVSSVVVMPDRTRLWFSFPGWGHERRADARVNPATLSSWQGRHVATTAGTGRATRCRESTQGRWRMVPRRREPGCKGPASRKHRSSGWTRRCRGR